MYYILEVADSTSSIFTSKKNGSPAYQILENGTVLDLHRPLYFAEEFEIVNEGSENKISFLPMDYVPFKYRGPKINRDQRD